MKKFFLILIVALSFIACVNSTSVGEDKKISNPDFNKWVKYLRKESEELGYEKEFLDKIFAEIHYSDEYIIQDKKQFKPQTFEEYFNNAVNDFRIKRSKKKLKKHNKILNKVESELALPKNYIVSLWTIETDMGRITGNYNILNSLANLSFNKRRRELFLREFMASIDVIKKNDIDPKEFKGSWAGAMGQCQFLPTTYLNHAVDFDKDGKIDIWNTQEDVFASISSYLTNIGWDNNLPWGYELENVKDIEKVTKINEKYALQYLILKYQIKKLDKSNFTDYELLSQAKLVKQGDRLFLVFSNFDKIKEWNNSTYFALTVGLLADMIDK